MSSTVIQTVWDETYEHTIRHFISGFNEEMGTSFTYESDFLVYANTNGWVLQYRSEARGAVYNWLNSLLTYPSLSSEGIDYLNNMISLFDSLPDLGFEEILMSHSLIPHNLNFFNIFLKESNGLTNAQYAFLKTIQGYLAALFVHEKLDTINMAFMMSMMKECMYSHLMIAPTTQEQFEEFNKLIQSTSFIEHKFVQKHTKYFTNTLNNEWNASVSESA